MSHPPNLPKVTLQDDNEIKKLLKKNVLEISQNEPDLHISPVLLRSKSDNSFRIILNLKNHNKFKPYIQFKVEIIYLVLQFFQSDCFLAT